MKHLETCLERKKQALFDESEAEKSPESQTNSDYFEELDIVHEKSEKSPRVEPKDLLKFEKKGDKCPDHKVLPNQTLVTSLLEPNYESIDVEAIYDHPQLRNLLHILDDEIFFVSKLDLYYENEINIYNKKNQEILTTKGLKQYTVSSFGCTPGYFAIGASSVLYVYTYPEKKLIFTHSNDSMVNQIFFTWYSGELHMIVPINDGDVFFYSIHGEEVKYMNKYHSKSYVNTISVSRDGLFFALAPDNGELSILYTESLKEYHVFDVSSKDPYRLNLLTENGSQFDCCTFNINSTMVAVAGSSSVFVFDLIHKTNLFAATLDRAHLCKFSPFSGNVLAVLGNKALGLLYIDEEFIHYEQFQIFEQQYHESAGLTFSYDGSQLYTVSSHCLCEFNVNKKFTKWALKIHESFLLNHETNIFFEFK